MAKQGRRYNQLLPWLIALVCVLGLLKLLSLFDPIRSAALAATQPITTRLYALGAAVRNAYTQPADIETLQAETERLRNEAQQLRQQLAALQQAEQDNIALRQLLDFFEDDAKSVPRVMARVSSRDPLRPTTIVLNVGERDGIQVNNAVVANEGVLVGKIIEVYAKSSRARLLTDQESSVAVSLSGGTPSSKLVRGEKGLSLLLDQVPQQETLRLGQLVITSGLEAAVPRGFLVGEVEEIVSEQNDLFQTAVLRPLVDYDALSIVAVVLSEST